MKSDRNPGLSTTATTVEGSWGGSRTVLPIETWLINRLMTLVGEPAVSVLLWDDQEHYRCAHSPPAALIRFTDRAAFWRIFLNPTLHFGEGYAAGLIQIEGNLLAFLDAMYHARVKRGHTGLIERYIKRGLARQRSNTLENSRDNIHHHYDVGNDFYRLWLDEGMAYTCAYFPERDATLEQAQFAKMDHVARKLELRVGDEVVEAGCGWGGLARHFARHYGVKVRAYNISSAQIAYARERAKAEGLEDRIEYIEDDYRNIQGRYDAFVSVGMLEHVGAENYATLGRVIDRVLKDDGRGLIHSIGQARRGLTDAWTEKYIFPGGYAPTLGQMMNIFEGPGLSVVDVENLRLHYAKTIEHWLERYDRHEEDVRQMFDDFFVRTWRLYLAASTANFRAGALQLYQVLFARPTKNDMAWTRAHLYRDQPSTGPLH
jgi:cyclopropane-fatty-acyl-phospholipid synthase